MSLTKKVCELLTSLGTLHRELTLFGKSIEEHYYRVTAKQNISLDIFSLFLIQN